MRFLRSASRVNSLKKKDKLLNEEGGQTEELNAAISSISISLREKVSHELCLYYISSISLQ